MNNKLAFLVITISLFVLLPLLLLSVFLFFQVIKMGREIRNGKSSENNLIIAKETAEKASNAKTTFPANMFHEIRAITALAGELESIDSPAAQYIQNQVSNFKFAELRELFKL